MGYKHRPFPNRLKVIRQNAGYSQSYVSRLLGLPDSNSLSLWELEKTMPSGTNLLKLCIIYKKAPKELYADYYNQLEKQLPDLYK